MSTHVLKVVPPYFEALVRDEKPFEVRLNDRGFQRGDVLHLREYNPAKCRFGSGCRDEHCSAWGATVVRRISFVYSGDPRFGGIEPGFVVLGLEHYEPVEDGS